MKQFGGPVIFLDRSDINTDEIIPARYLVEVKKEALGPHLLEDLELPGFDPRGEVLKRARVVVSRANFGCGSSREHAPWAFEVNDIYVVVAENFARIFRQNMFNGGMLAIELSKADIEKIFAFAGGQEKVECDVDFSGRSLVFHAGSKTLQQPFVLSEFDASLVQAGGWVEFADTRY